MLDTVLTVINVTIMSALKLSTTLPSVPIASDHPQTYSSRQTGLIPLVIGGFFPLTNNEGMGLGRSNYFASLMALNDIRKSGRILTAYNLTMIAADTQVYIDYN